MPIPKISLPRVTVERVLYWAIIAIGIVMLLRSCGDDTPVSDTKPPPLTPTVQKTDKKGTAYTEIKGTLYTEAQMKHLTDSFRKVLGKGKVTSVVTTVTDIDTFFKQDTLYVDLNTGDIYAADSSSYHKVSYTGNYLLRTGEFQLKFRPDTATYVTTIKNKWFGPDVMTTNVYNTNPFFRPSMGSSYTSKARRTLLVAGPMLGAGYSSGIGGIQAFIGLGITVPVISIRSK